jgi:opacity protein-like surface antigen
MRALSIVLVVAALSARSAAAQWYVGIELGVAHYHGTARDTSNSGGPDTFRPGDAASIGVRLGRQMGRIGLALRATYGIPGIGAAGQDLTITDRSTGALIEVTPVVAVRLTSAGLGSAVRAEIGPTLHLWKLSDEVRSRLGALGALAYEWPIVARWSGAIRAEGTISRSWWNAGDLPPEYARRPTWRYGMSVGLRYRL